MLVFNKEQIRRIESTAVESGFSETRMMENAGSAASKIIEERFDITNKKIVIVVGKGNNGGDGFVVARKLFEAKRDVSVILADEMPTTAASREMLSKLTVYPIRLYNSFDADTIKVINSADVIIDAVFGIGFKGELDPKIAGILEIINKTHALKIALDIPSGAECDTGKVANNCFNANATISFIAIKPCHVLFPSAEFCGKLFKAGIGLPPQIANSISSKDIIIEDVLIKAKFPKRPKNSHKGSFGRLALLCGSYGMAGASILATRSALRSGVGLADMIIPDDIYPIVASSVCEAVCSPYNASDGVMALRNIEQKISESDAVVAGCGLGQSEFSKKAINLILESSTKPMVLDADGLNIAAENLDALYNCKAKMVLTPHPAEMARLLKTTTKEIQSNRFACATLLAQRTQQVVVLKGANSVIAIPDGRRYICTKGNAGMATGGSGDVLSGIIGAFLAQGFTPEDAAICGTWIHAFAGDCASKEKSMTAMLPSDIIDFLPNVFKELE